MIKTPIWDTGEWPGLAPLDTHIEAEVSVVGLVGSGLAAVEEALRLGQTVVGIDDRRKARAIDLVVCRS
ncbi:MAG: hypothetical protein IH818_10500 [Acidobacteria bacterium]|nr:hypothetical protein [Acidobacteriota bacterium]